MLINKGRLCELFEPLWTDFDAADSLLEESRFTGDTLHAVTANTGLTAEVTALTPAFFLVLGVVTYRTL